MHNYIRTPKAVIEAIIDGIAFFDRDGIKLKSITIDKSSYEHIDKELGSKSNKNKNGDYVFYYGSMHTPREIIVLSERVTGNEPE